METSQKGLSTVEAESRRSLYGENVLSDQPRPPEWQKIIRQVRHPFILLMILAAIISLWQKDLTLALVPMKRFGKPEEIASAVLWMCSDEASFMTGREMVIGGGQAIKA